MAATLTAENELTYVSFPIEKFETTDDGDLIVYGKATDGSIDSDEQIVDPRWAEKALPAWLETGGNIRVQHNAQRDPAGRGLAVDVTPDGHFVKSLIVEPTAKRLVEKGVLRAYSVGIARPVVERDMTGKARGGIIKGGELAEISLVDRPANKNCTFTLVKADKTGVPEAVEKLDGDRDFIAKNAGIPSPSQVAMVVKHRHDTGAADRTYADPAAQRLADALAAENDAVVKAAEPAAEKRDFDRNVGGGVDRDKLPAADFAGRNRSFPIVTQADVSDALMSIGRAGKDNYDPATLRRNIIRIARRKGFKIPKSDRDASKVLAAQGAKSDPYDAQVTAHLEDAHNATDEALRDQMMDNAHEDDDKKKSKKKSMKAAGKAKKGGMKKPRKVMPPPSREDEKTENREDPDMEKAAKLRARLAKLQRELDKALATDGVRDKDSKAAPEGRNGASLDSVMGHAVHPDEVWGKAMDRSTDAPYAVQRLHDAACAAYAPDLVKAAYPSMTDLAKSIDATELREAALAAVAEGDLARGEQLLGVAKAADELVRTDPAVLEDARAALHKSFTDMYPSVRLSPGQIMPQQFQRPYIHEGHAETPAPSGDVSPGAVPSYHPTASDFRRGPITAGHEAPSPGNKGDSSPFPAGTPVATVYAHAVSNLQRVHDHYASAYNGVCPMSMSSGVPVGAAARKATDTGVAKGRKKKGKVRKPPKEMGPMTTIPPMPAQPDSMKAAVPDQQAADITVLLAQAERRMRKLQKRQQDEIQKMYEKTIRNQGTEIAELRRSVEELGAQPNMTDGPNRFAMTTKAASGVAPAERRSLVDESGWLDPAYLREKREYLTALSETGDPVLREGALAQIRKMQP